MHHVLPAHSMQRCRVQRWPFVANQCADQQVLLAIGNHWLPCPLLQGHPTSLFSSTRWQRGQHCKWIALLHPTWAAPDLQVEWELQRPVVGYCGLANT